MHAPISKYCQTVNETYKGSHCFNLKREFAVYCASIYNSCMRKFYSFMAVNIAINVKGSFCMVLRLCGFRVIRQSSHIIFNFPIKSSTLPDIHTSSQWNSLLTQIIPAIDYRIQFLRRLRVSMLNQSLDNYTNYWYYIYRMHGHCMWIIKDWRYNVLIKPIKLQSC